MALESSILIQKQARDNSEDLQSEFLDMKNWEEQMKKADAQIRKASGKEVLPPIRKKKKVPKETQQQQREGEKSKRIKSWDYTLWDKFDVEKACEALERGNESSDSGEEPFSKEELEQKLADATEHKVQGNVFVQQKQWVKGIACYNKAIEIFPYSAVFFANRAFCQLQLDNLHSAEADCTAALQLDENYVKAYHRRATARIKLKHYKEASEDLKQLLNLEPSNKEAKSMLARVNKSLDNSKPCLISTTPPKETEPISDKIVVKEAESKAEPRKQENVIEKSDIPDWIPEKLEDVRIVEVITKAPHQRSKVPLRTVPVTEIEFGESTLSTPKDPVTETLQKPLSGDSKKEVVPPIKVDLNVRQAEIPEAPKSSVQFLATWRRNKSTEFRYEYFKQISAECIPSLFRDSMESNIFSEILKVLRLEFAKREESVFEYLRYLSQVKRFRTLTMFMSKSDKDDLQMLFHYSQKVEHQREDVVNDLAAKYEI